MIDRRTVISAVAGLILPSPIAARGAPDFLDPLTKEGRYLPSWARLMANDPMMIRPQYAAFLGDETTALAASGQFDYPLADLSGATGQRAIDAIRSAAVGRSVVMLNEAHVASRHRMFLTQMLRALRGDGFTHFAAETFSNSAIPAEQAVQRLRAGDPVTGGVGFYTCDPVFAEAVREALELGYQLLPYEARPAQTAGAAPADLGARREQAEAENFAAALKASPQGRFIIYVGYSHLAKAPDPSGKAWFALRLRSVAGVDPLTIDQAYPGSFGPHGHDGPLATAVLTKF